MKEIQVFDKFQGENFLINLSELIKRLEQIDTSLTDGEWQIANGAYGYGELICSIEDAVKNGSKYLVTQELKVKSIINQCIWQCQY